MGDNIIENKERRKATEGLSTRKRGEEWKRMTAGMLELHHAVNGQLKG